MSVGGFFVPMKREARLYPTPYLIYLHHPLTIFHAKYDAKTCTKHRKNVTLQSLKLKLLHQSDTDILHIS